MTEIMNPQIADGLQYLSKITIGGATIPYLKEGRKKELLTEPQRASNDGDFNFLFTQEYLKVFNAEPRYKTIALIRKASLTPSKLEGVKRIEDLLTVQGVNQLDRIVARDLAFQEFYRRIGGIYEDTAIVRNGDVETYKEAEHMVFERPFSEISPELK